MDYRANGLVMADPEPVTSALDQVDIAGGFASSEGMVDEEMYQADMLLGVGGGFVAYRQL